ncbi:MAG: iron ABC transporter permease [Chloroflexi bacterium]|nr:iron ABC transporter permease [Chloroflexota bacterium]
MFVLGIVSIIVTFLTVVPLAFLVWGSFNQGNPATPGGLTLQNYVRVYTDPATLKLFTNSVWYAGGSSVLALLIGTALAWIVERTDTPLRKVFFALTLVPLLTPGVLVTIAWLYLLNPRNGFINHLAMNLFGLGEAPFDVYTMWGMIWIDGLAWVPLAFLLMGAALRSMDPSLEESAMMSGAGIFVTLRRVTLRLMLPAIASVSLIIFVRALESFEVPALVGVPGGTFVFTSRIYLALRQISPDFGLAAALSLSLLVLGVIGLYFYYRATARTERFATVTGKAFRPRMISMGKWRYATAGIYVLYCVVTIGLPLFILVWSSLNPFYRQPSLTNLDRLNLNAYFTMLNSDVVRPVFFNSLTLAIGSATLVMLLTAVVAWMTVKTTIPGRQILDAVAFLPIAFPGIVLGVSLLWVYLFLPIPIYGTIWILIIAYITRFMPYGMRACSSSMIQIHKELEEAAYASGASWLNTFGRIIVPLLKPGLLAGWIYVAILSIKELSSSILLYSSQSRVLSVHVFNLWDMGQQTQVSALAMITIAVLTVFVLIALRLGATVGVRE